MAKSIFITATGTDIGKTFISALIVKKMRELGVNCGYYKPVLSGLGENNLNDAHYVLNCANLNIDFATVISYGFKPSVSPHLAAIKEGKKISIDKIHNDYKRLSESFEYLVVEGAGGITCPLILDDNTPFLLSDLIKFLDLDILLVADAGLGTINYTLLTVEYARLKGLNIKGIILNNFDETNYMHQDNLIQVERLTRVNVVAKVPKDADDIVINNEVLKGLFT